MATLSFTYTSSNPNYPSGTSNYTRTDTFAPLAAEIEFGIGKTQLLTATLVGELTGTEWYGGLFEGCNNLTTLDLTNCDVSHLNTFENMFKNCSNLAVIYCNDDWSSSTYPSTSMFNNCGSLVGAISYDSSKTDIQYANPTTGYFTSLTPLTEKKAKFNGNDVDDIYFNGTKVNEVYFNGNKVFG